MLFYFIKRLNLLPSGPKLLTDLTGQVVLDCFIFAPAVPPDLITFPALLLSTNPYSSLKIQSKCPLIWDPSRTSIGSPVGALAHWK
jgi:hypothetical protein